MDDETVARIIRANPRVVPYLVGHASELARKQMYANYDDTRAHYWAEVYDFVLNYLSGRSPITSYRNGMQSYIADAYLGAVEQGYIDGGGTLPIDEETQTWVDGEINAEREFAAGMFEHLRDDAIGDYEFEASDRADGYTASLDAIYAYGKLVGASNVMLTCVGDDGKESCEDCQRVVGERHRASWWVENGYPPSRDFECHGYNCDHHLEDDEGNRWSGDMAGKRATPLWLAGARRA